MESKWLFYATIAGDRTVNLFPSTQENVGSHFTVSARAMITKSENKHLADVVLVRCVVLSIASSMVVCESNCVAPSQACILP